MLAILQFDSPALSLVERMLAAGRLPTLDALRARGRWHTMDAKATFLQSSTYMTLCTGVDVRDHGVYSAVPWSAAEQRPRFMYSWNHPPTIWDRLTARGKRSLVIDPTLAWAPDSMNGVFLGGWQFSDRMSARGVSQPVGVRKELSRRYGRPPALDDVYGVKKVVSLLAWRDHLVKAPARAASAAVDLFRRDSFDVAWVNFAAPHKAGHHLWDPAGAMDGSLGADDERSLRDSLADVYESVDTAVARVVEALPPSADIIVFSPTGMAANTSRADLLPRMLDAVLNGTAHTATSNRRSPIWSLRSAVPAAWRDRIARMLPDDMVADIATRLYLRQDWTRTRAIAVPGENKGYIRLNLRGREQHGIVDASEVDALCDTIARGLVTFTDTDGSPSITRVERMTQMTDRGTHVGALPDLVVHWGDTPATRVSRVQSPVHGEVIRQGVGSGRSGNHVDDAWVIVVPGKSRPCDVGRAPRITDIGATACTLADADGNGLSGTSLLERS
jgi:predicted AlkP superfamily phosphohydrolase/phosphomutase